jgi:uncharacterized protein (TIGR02145 family)
MNRVTLFTICLFTSVFSRAQDINISFAEKNADHPIDSITAINLSTNQAITLPGNETLVLKGATGVPDIPLQSDQLAVYPNPFSGESSIRVSINEPQKVSIRLISFAGQVMTRLDEFLQSGIHEFAFSLKNDGIYTVILGTQQGLTCLKVINLSGQVGDNRIRYMGMGTDWKPAYSDKELKSNNSGYSLDYTEGDVILYYCYNSVMTTVLTEIPTVSKTHEVEFARCFDGFKNYKVVYLGDQTWMAESLSSLPTVSPSRFGSNTVGYYYVIGYEGYAASEARLTDGYSKYGVLYNWEASKTACPPGWHLPSDQEWKTLEEYFGMNAIEANDTGVRNSGDIARKLKSTSGWENDGNGNNSSGFSALPGGSRSSEGGGDLAGSDWSAYNGQLDYTMFWSSTENDSLQAWTRGLGGVGNVWNRYPIEHGYGFSVRCVKDN